MAGDEDMVGVSLKRLSGAFFPSGVSLWTAAASTAATRDEHITVRRSAKHFEELFTARTTIRVGKTGTDVTIVFRKRGIAAGKWGNIK